MPRTKQRPYLMRDPKAIRLLASPLRHAILDVIVARGAATIAELALHFRRPADRLYYHIRLLERAGLLISTDGINGDGRAEATFDVPGRPMRLIYGDAGAPSRRAVGRVIGGMLQSARRAATGALEDATVVTDGPHRELWAGRVEGRLTENEVAQVNAALVRVIAIIERSRVRSGDDGKFYQFTWVLSPAEERPNA